MITHAEARAYARAALIERYGSTTDGEVAALAGIACLETSYGSGWRGAGKSSNNMGAIQAGKEWGGARFTYTDTHPNSDGTSTPYRVDFRSYPSPEAGFADLARVMYEVCGRRLVRLAASEKDYYGVSRAMYQTHYYEGFGASPNERVANHYRALSAAIARADGSIAPQEPAPQGMPTIRRGSTGEAVKMLQRELGLVADGIFGPVTEARLREVQGRSGLKVDGVCGPATWAEVIRT